jgi:hypothetical protein
MTTGLLSSTAGPVQTNRATNSLVEGLRDIKSPVAISTGWEWMWWALGVAAIAVLLLGLLIFLMTRRKRISLPPVIPPHQRAKERLEEALALIGMPKPFTIAVSDALRTYLEERFRFRAPERTTEEFLHELKRTELLLPDQKEGLGEFLQRCDLVKFAQYEPSKAELLTLHGAACRLIDETAPHPEPAIEPGQAQTAGRPVT